MLRDTFYAYGSLTKFLNTVIVVCGAIFVVVIKIWNVPVDNSFLVSIYRIIGFVLLIALTVKGIWRMANRSPMLVTYNPWSEVVIKSCFFAFQWGLLLTVLCSFAIFMLDVNTLYLKDGTKLSMDIFNAHIIPFSVLKFIDFLIEEYGKLNLISTYYYVRIILSICINFVIPVSFIGCVIFLARASTRGNRTSDIHTKGNKEYHRSLKALNQQKFGLKKTRR